MSKDVKYLIVVAGPTGIGKSKLSLALSESINCQIISADSRQLYQEINIGTAKPTIDDLQKVKHHFINHLSIEDSYSAGQYERECLSLLDSIYHDNDVAIITGGTGFYIDAVLEGLDEFPNVNPIIKSKIEDEFQQNGITYLQDQLIMHDPDYADLIDMNNSRRLVRALSVIRSSGKKYSSFLKKNKQVRGFTPIKILLEIPRENLYSRINTRVDVMIDQGLEEEARNLYSKKSYRSLDTVGYKELFKYFEGSISRNEAIELIKRDTRRYAKRQLTWWRQQEGWKVFHPDDLDDILHFINKNTDSYDMEDNA